MTAVSRRRFLSISAAVCALPSFAAASQPTAHWRGVALGAEAQMQIAGLSQTEADPIFAAVEAEIGRLEDIFSLYRPHSALSQLNAKGEFLAPPPEMLELLSLCSALHSATKGAFDPSVQPLWQAYALGNSAKVEMAKDLVGFDRVRFDASAVRFAKPNMALTLNGIAQGYIADRVAHLMRRQGLGNLVINTGEVMALGQRAEGGPWRVGVTAPGNADLLAKLPLTDRALATSAPLGSTIGDTHTAHILDPRTGTPANAWTVVSVSADRAALADGLSTAMAILSREEIDRVLRVFGTANLEYLG